MLVAASMEGQMGDSTKKLKAYRAEMLALLKRHPTVVTEGFSPYGPTLSQSGEDSTSDANVDGPQHHIRAALSEAMTKASSLYLHMIHCYFYNDNNDGHH